MKSIQTPEPLWIESDRCREIRELCARDRATLERIAKAGNYLIPMCIALIVLMFFKF